MFNYDQKKDQNKGCSKTGGEKFLCIIPEHKCTFAREIRKRLGEPEIGDGSFRERITPKLNFEAKTLQKLIDWEDVINEPVLTTEIPTGKF